MPTIIIGLGGTGTKVVRKIRERWQREVGNVPSDVELAVIDARQHAPEGGFIEDVRFTPNPPIDFTASYNEFKEDVASWFPRNLVPSAEIDFS